MLVYLSSTGSTVGRELPRILQGGLFGGLHTEPDWFTWLMVCSLALSCLGGSVAERICDRLAALYCEAGDEIESTSKMFQMGRYPNRVREMRNAVWRKF